jgi:hypothetical protein
MLFRRLPGRHWACRQTARGRLRAAATGGEAGAKVLRRCRSVSSAGSRRCSRAFVPLRTAGNSGCVRHYEAFWRSRLAGRAERGGFLSGPHLASADDPVRMRNGMIQINMGVRQPPNLGLDAPRLGHRARKP